jgi:stage V sporulation protein G
MNVTDVRVRRISTEEGKMKAIVSLTIDEDFVVHDIRVVEGNNGLFVAMPSRKTPSGDFRDVAHPITPESRAKIQDAVLAAYEEALKNQQTAAAAVVVETAPEAE